MVVGAGFDRGSPDRRSVDRRDVSTIGLTGIVQILHKRARERGEAPQVTVRGVVHQNEATREAEAPGAARGHCPLLLTAAICRRANSACG